MVAQIEALQAQSYNVHLAEGQPEHLAPLAQYLVDNIRSKTERLEAEGRAIGVMDPDWCRANPAEAGRMHAEVIVKTYGSTYALPNKDPIANKKAIEEGNLDIYLMTLDGEVTGTTSLVNMGDGRAELGRSASLGSTGNTIIQDLRILDWLINPDTAAKYHTLFTTLRSATDRTIDDVDSTFLMRGGQAVTEHWRKFPSLLVNGFGPLYLKHGMLEQFTLASLTRNQINPEQPLYIADSQTNNFVDKWHEHYQLPLAPTHRQEAPKPLFVGFEAHYPPAESGLTGLVHADIVPTDKPDAKNLGACLIETQEAGSPFTQVVMPLDRDTRIMQTALDALGYQVFGYQPATDMTAPALLYGRVRDGVGVVPTHWSHAGADNPFWQDTQLHAAAETIASRW